MSGTVSLRRRVRNDALMVTEIMRLVVQLVQTRFFCTVAGLCHDTARTLAIWQSLRGELWFRLGAY